MTKIKPNSLRNLKTVAAKRVFIEKERKLNLSAISHSNFDEVDVAGHNIENLIGSTQIPLGIAGPISVHHALSTKHYYLPLATTEGALVASISRGCKAITESGGAIVALNNIGITRGPVFRTKNITHSHDTQRLINKNLTKLKIVARKTSSHLTLTKIDVNFVGKNLYCRFYFDTTDAMGMNMATFASEQVCHEIEKFTGATLIALAGNFDIDKKPAWLNFINGRGKQVWAEITVPKSVVKGILKTAPEKIVEIVKTKQHLGSIMSGSMGFNAHFANIIAALFISTGQDPAHIVEGSLGITTAEVEPDESLYFSIYLPSLVVGTVGGGTQLPTQKEAIQIIGAKNAEEFAKIIGAAVLAGELSLTASLAEGTLTKAHKTLARKTT